MLNVKGVIMSRSVLVLLACFQQLSFINSLPVSVNRNFYPGATTTLFQNQTFIDLPWLSNLIYYECNLYTHMHVFYATLTSLQH